MSLNIALLQTTQKWEDIPSNLKAAEPLVMRAEADLVALPEMFATGFSMNTRATAEAMDGRIVDWLAGVCCRSGKAIITSAAIKLPDCEGNQKYVNRLFFIRPDGHMQYYDKHHLFRMGGERDAFEPGQTPRLVVEYKGFRIMPVICYDLRFPVWCRNRGDYDLFLDVASWAAPRREVWVSLLKARAIENVAYAAGVNRVGDDPTAHYSGDSLVYNFRGEELCRARPDEEQIVTATLEMDKLRAFREKFPVHLDADPFELI